jgi:hypothetical protein
LISYIQPPSTFVAHPRTWRDPVGSVRCL